MEVFAAEKGILNEKPIVAYVDASLRNIDDTLLSRVQDSLDAMYIEEFDSQAVPEKYSHIDFKPPKDVQKAYQNGLKRHENGETGDGLEEATVRMARKFAKGQATSPEWARKGNRWWARNERFADEEPGSPAYASSQLWGSRNWFAHIVEQMDAADEEAKANLSDLGKTIRDAREAKQMTQEDLGKKVNRDKNTVSGIERGTIKNPPESVLKDLAEALGLTLETLQNKVSAQDSSKVSEKVEKSLKDKLDKHQEDVGDDKRKQTTLGKLKQVYNRGIGAFKTNPESVRPNVKSKERWAMARVNSYLKALKDLKFDSGKHDTDLLPDDHPSSGDESDGFDLYAALENLHPALMYASAVMVSAVMNSNDDVFMPEDLWAKGETVLHQPFNDNHKKPEVRGHIVDYRFVDDNYQEVQSLDDLAEEDVLSIEAFFVIYKNIFPEFAEGVEELAEDGMVSMECRANNFDYLLVPAQASDDDASATIVARNENTAFLTKYLRCYGGDGFYEGQRVGRVLRDYHFTGLGNVGTGANKRSYYTSLNGKNFKNVDAVKNFSCINKREEVFSSDRNFYILGNQMKTVSSLDDAQKVIADLEAKLEEYKEGETAKKIEELKEAKATLESDISSRDEKIQTLEEAREKMKKKEEEDEETRSALEKERDDLKAELDQIKTQALGQSRVSDLKAAGREFSDEEAAVDKYAKMTEDAFAEILEVVQETYGKMHGDDDEKKQKKEDEKAAAEAEARKQLENGSEDTDPNLEAQAAHEDRQKQGRDIMARALSVINKKDKE